MEYPKGTKFNNWILYKEKQKGGKSVTVIRRRIIFESGQSKYERLPTKRYKSLRNDPDELKLFVVRLNQEIPLEQRTIQAIEIRHAYISPTLLDTYKEFLYAQMPSKDRANHEHNLLMKYFLGFFINVLNIPDPLQWHKIHKTEWANFLLSNKAPESMRSKKEIVSAANRFMGWLHDRRPEEVPPLKFAPISLAKAKEVEAIRELKGNTHKPQYIKEFDWALIKKKLPANIKAVALLSYSYGLRRSEAMALMFSNIRTGFLSVEQQVTSFSNQKMQYGPLKGREKRKVPHWSGTPKETYELVKLITPMHPDTLTTKWTEFMAELNMDYTFHDLRHTWITKMMRLQVPRDVQLAAGHKDLRTTMGYLHDDRDLIEKQYLPEGA